jgi:hypothetical protein
MWESVAADQGHEPQLAAQVAPQADFARRAKLSEAAKAKKNPSTKLGLEAFFAVKHQGPAQGGKAGGGEPPTRNLTKPGANFKPASRFLCLQYAHGPSKFPTCALFHAVWHPGRWNQAQFSP